MTNEELATRIKAGERELTSELWEQVRKYLYYRASRFYKANCERCARAGFTLDDLGQECYFVFLKAVQYWKPESGYKFTTFLDFPFQSTCRQLLGIARKQTDPLNVCVSLDRPAKEEDSEGSTILDLQADETSSEFVLRVEQEIISRLIESEVNTLSEPVRSVVTELYFEGRTRTSIAASSVYDSFSKRDCRNSERIRYSARFTPSITNSGTNRTAPHTIHGSLNTIGRHGQKNESSETVQADGRR